MDFAFASDANAWQWECEKSKLAEEFAREEASFFRSFNSKKALKSTFLLFSAGPDNQHVLLASLKAMPSLCHAAMILEKLVPDNALVRS